MATKRKGPTPRRSAPAADTTSGGRAQHHGRRVILIGVLAVVVLVVLVIAFDALRIVSGIRHVTTAMPGSGGGGTTYLIVGNDSREGTTSLGDQTKAGLEEQGGSKADILMVLRVPDDGPPVLVSIPRDLIVRLPGAGFDRITLAFEDGPKGIVDAVCTNLGIGADHVVIVGFDGFVSLIDQLGGVEVYTGVPIKDDASGFRVDSAGNHLLDGRQALAYVRSRHPQALVDGLWIPLGGGAKSRLDHSKQIASQVASKLKATRNPLRLRALAEAGTSAVTTDEGVGFGDLRSLADALSTVANGTDRTTVDLPVLTHDDLLSTSELNDESVRVLQSIGAGRQPACPLPVPRRISAPTTGPPVPAPDPSTAAGPATNLTPTDAPDPTAVPSSIGPPAP